MTLNYFEELILDSLRDEFERGLLRNEGNSEIFFSRLMQYFPLVGSKIDWSRVPGAIEYREEKNELQPRSFMSFLREMIEREGLAGPAVYVGDGSIDFAIGGDLDRLFAALPTILEVPHHHYVIGSDTAWCACLTMEGYIAFGKNPSLHLGRN